MKLRIVHLLPRLLGTYGDRGNVLVAAHRARARGIDVDVVEVEPGDNVPPDASLYFLGGGEDLAQTQAVEMLRRDGGLVAAVARGAAVFAVCAGFQLLGASFETGAGVVEGLGLLDATTVVEEPRAVGEVLVDGGPLGTLTGFENHGGRTRLGSSVAALGPVVHGVGNGDGRDGATRGRILATYLHGPVLARNPRLADHVLELALGTELEPLADRYADSLHAERLDAVRAAARSTARRRRSR